VTCVNTALGQFGKGTATVSTTVKRAPDYEEPEN
jgi:hypothetical protein